MVSFLIFAGIVVLWFLVVAGHKTMKYLSKDELGVILENDRPVRLAKPPFAFINPTTQKLIKINASQHIPNWQIYPPNALMKNIVDLHKLDYVRFESVTLSPRLLSKIFHFVLPLAFFGFFNFIQFYLKQLIPSFFLLNLTYLLGFYLLFSAINSLFYSLTLSQEGIIIRTLFGMKEIKWIDITRYDYCGDESCSFTFHFLNGKKFRLQNLSRFGANSQVLLIQDFCRRFIRQKPS